MTLRLGTRASLLARTQSQLVADAVTAETGRAVELVPLTTQGDITPGSLLELGGTGVFATAVREALLAHECDFVVHSMKDLPSAPYAGLRLGAVPPRADPGDVLVSRDGVGLADLPPGARVGTGSPRRVAQVRRRRPDLDVLDIRGNVDTRLRKVDEGEYDAIVLAAAGIERLGLAGRVTERFAVEEWPTSAGQGALAVEIREDDADGDLAAALARVGHAASEAAALLERAVLARLEAGCAAPVGVSARHDGDVVRLVVEVYRPDGARSVRVEHALDRASAASAARRAEAAVAVVDRLFAGGAGELAPLGGGPAT